MSRWLWRRVVVERSFVLNNSVRPVDAVCAFAVVRQLFALDRPKESAERRTFQYNGAGTKRSFRVQK